MSAVLQMPLSRVFSHAAFADRLKRARKGRGVSQVALAERMGVNPWQVSCWERCINLPRMDLLIVLAMTLDVDLEWLVFGDPTRGPRLS